jgi:acyl dehydratase
MRSVPLKHILEHGPMLRALGATALGALRGPRSTAKPETPGSWFETEVKPPSPELVRAFVASTGGEQSSYRGVLPPQLFPQWTLATASKALANLPYPLARIVNAGCRLDVRDRIPAGEPLIVRAQLASIDENETRVVMTTRIETGTRSTRDALVAELRTFVPLAKPKTKDKGDTPRVAAESRELARTKLSANAGLEFAKLTGDFNPIHWLAPYAKSAGFRGCILHGFGTFAIAASAVVKGLLSGDASGLRSLDVRFTRPLLLPARAGVYVTTAGELFVGDAPGGAAYLAGRYQIGDAR